MDNFLNVLGIVFIVLKLIGTITWSWWFVLLPLIVNAFLHFVAMVLSYATLKSLFGSQWFRFWKW